METGADAKDSVERLLEELVTTYDRRNALSQRAESTREAITDQIAKRFDDIDDRLNSEYALHKKQAERDLAKDVASDRDGVLQYLMDDTDVNAIAERMMKESLAMAEVGRQKLRELLKAKLAEVNSALEVADEQCSLQQKLSYSRLVSIAEELLIRQINNQKPSADSGNSAAFSTTAYLLIVCRLRQIDAATSDKANTLARLSADFERASAAFIAGQERQRMELIQGIKHLSETIVQSTNAIRDALGVIARSALSPVHMAGREIIKDAIVDMTNGE